MLLKRNSRCSLEQNQRDVAFFFFVYYMHDVYIISRNQKNRLAEKYLLFSISISFLLLSFRWNLDVFLEE